MPAEQVVTVRLTQARVLRVLRRVPASCGGNSPAARALLVRVGLAALAKVKKAFVEKARGGADECGLRWPRLSPKTVAYSRRHPGVPARRPFWTYHPSFAVTKRQRARWWQLYGRFKAAFGGDKHRAAALAWVVLKREGDPQTLMRKFGHTPVEILRDRGLLLNSLGPAILPGEPAPPVPPPKAPRQVFRLGRGEVGVGTNRKWAGTHHRGVPGRVPRRPLWPDPRSWVPSWWDEILGQARRGVADLIVYLLRGNP